MADRPLAAVVLAAGQGTRMRASVPKVLVQCCGRALVEHVLAALRPLAAQPTVVVYGHGGDLVKKALSDRDVRFAHQAEQNGTGHAVQCALPELGDFDGDVLVLCGDTPLLTTAVLEALVADHRAADRALTVLSAELADPGALGRVLRGPDGKLAAIREAADAAPAELSVREINTGVMVLRAATLAGALDRLRPDNAQGELYLTDVPGLLLSDGLAVDAHMTRDEGSALGVNNPLELAQAARLLRARALDALLAAGVRVEDPATTVVDAGVEVGPGTVLRPFTSLGRGVRIGRDCIVGPHADVRDGAVVGDGVLLGAHTEVRGTTLGDGVSAPGPARLVGAAVGAGARIGPGVVTEAEGGDRVVVGEGAEIGAGARLVAPTTVGERSTVKPGTLWTRNEGTEDS